MSANNADPYRSPDLTAEGLSRSAWKMSRIEIFVLVVIVVVFALLILPAIQSSHSAASQPRHRCKNNLTMIGLALHNYHDVYGSFPPAVVLDSTGGPMHSWRVLILPFLEERQLYDQYFFDEPWDGPRNSLLYDQRPDVYACPAYDQGVKRDSPEGQHLSQLTNYVAITAPGAVFDGATATALNEISDPNDQTSVVVEVRQHAVNWMSPQDATLAELLTDLRRSVSETNANHVGGLHTLRADGSVRYVPHDVTADDLGDAISKDGGEQLPSDFY